MVEFVLEDARKPAGRLDLERNIVDVDCAKNGALSASEWEALTRNRQAALRLMVFVGLRSALD